MGLYLRPFKKDVAIVAIGCMFMITFVVLFYTNATSVTMVNISLFALGALIFGPQLLIGVSLTGFVPKMQLVSLTV